MTIFTAKLQIQHRLFITVVSWIQNHLKFWQWLLAAVLYFSSANVMVLAVTTEAPPPTAAYALHKSLQEQINVALQSKDWNTLLAISEQVLAVDANYIPALHMRTLSLSGMKRYDGAVASSEQVITLDPENHFAYQQLCWNGTLLRQLDSAKISCARALSLSPDFSNSINFAHVYLLQDNEATARVMYERSMLFITNPEQLQNALDDFNLFETNGWQPEQVRRIRPWFKDRFERWHKAIQTIIPLGLKLKSENTIQDTRANLDEAQRLYAMSNELLGDDSLVSGLMLMMVSSQQFGTGEYELALKTYQRADAVISKADPDGNTTVTLFARMMGSGVAYALGQYGNAIDQARKARDIAIRLLGKDEERTLVAERVLAQYSWSIGANEEALAIFERHLALHQKREGAEGLKVAQTLIDIARCLKNLDQQDRAEEMAKQALAIYEQHGSDAHITRNALGLLADLEEDRGDYGKAIEYQKRVVALDQSELGNEHPITISKISRLARYYSSVGDTSKAMPLHSEALQLASTVQDPKVRMHVDQNIAVHFALLGDRKTAILFGKRAINTSQGVRNESANLDAELTNRLERELAPIYQLVADWLVAEGRISEAQTVLQMLKERELYDSLVRSGKADVRTTHIELTGLERKRFAKYYEIQEQQAPLLKEREQLQRKQKNGELTTKEQQRLKEINSQIMPRLRDAMKVFIAQLQKDSNKYARDKDYLKGEQQLAQSELNLQNMLKQLKVSHPQQKVVALQYIVTDDRLSILLSTADNPPLARQIAINGKTFREQIFKVRTLLENSQSKPEWVTQALQSLHAQLIAPIAPDLKTLGAQTLVLVPNDVLRYVPYAALYNGNKYLIEDYALVYFNEAVKKDFKSTKYQDLRIVAMGLSNAVGKLPALTNVPDELKDVTTQSGLPGQSFINDAFTRSVLTATLNQNFNILHLASHFEFVAGRSDASRLFLGDSSSLYLGDIARENMRFDHFGLVTFSACETGLGSGLDDDGREMESLGALVQLQGSKAVMSTLWKVSDYSTPEIMKQFYYSRFHSKLDMANALRQVQVAFIHNQWNGARQKWKNPYYWAPFVMMGDWR